MLQRFAVTLSAAALVATVACAQSDAGITTAVKAKMATDDIVKAHEIAVDTNDHVVTLTGTVDSTAVRDRAAMIARDTRGVTRVVDNMTVSSRDATATAGSVEDKLDAAGQTITDAAITSAVKAKFLAEPGVPGTKIDVDTSNGVVTLSGIVKSRAEVEKAMSAARDTTGVKSVVDNLRVQ